MIEMSDNEKQTRFFRLGDSSTYTAEARGTVLWAQNRIEYLERRACDIGELLKQREEQIANLQSHLQERNATIDQLEAKSQDNRTHTRQTLSSMLPESDEERHQRHRRERMLDEVTLICVRDGIERMKSEPIAEHTWGRMSRDAAENICDGIDEFDSKQ